MPYYTWLHHETPIEWSDDVNKRKAFIRRMKPKHERLRRFAAIKRIPGTYNDAISAIAPAGLNKKDALILSRRFAPHVKVRRQDKKNFPYRMVFPRPPKKA